MLKSIIFINKILASIYFQHNCVKITDKLKIPVLYFNITFRKVFNNLFSKKFLKIILNFLKNLIAIFSHKTKLDKNI